MEQLDPTIKALATAIKRQETGGSKDPYNTKGPSGEFGAYQFMPETWKAWSTKHLGDANAPMTIENQNRVAYNQIKEWKTKGYNPAQVAAAWNAGEGKVANDVWKSNVGVNEFGVKYDTPHYVKNVSKYYRELNNSQPEQPQVTTTEITKQNKPGFFASVGNAITNPFLALGGGVANIIRPILGRETSGEKIPSLFGGEGVNPIGYRDGQELGATDTTKQLVGNVAMAGSNLVGAGALKSVGTGIVKSLLPKVGTLAKEGAIAGGLFSGGESLSEGKTTGEVITNTAIGAGVGAIATPLFGVPIGLIPLFRESGRKAVTKQLETKYVSQAVDDWGRVGTDYVKSGGVLKKEGRFGKDSPTFLGELGITPRNLVVDGKFQTEQLAQELSTTAIKEFDDTLTDMLKSAQFGKAFANLDKLQNTAIKSTSEIKATAAQKEAIIRSIKQEFSALKRQYGGNKIPLSELNTQKGNYWSNTKFDATKPFQSDVNYVIGSAMKKGIENEAGDAPVRELNSLLGDYYSAAKFLRSINNRIPKMTATQKLASNTVKAFGTAVGGTLGGVPGAVSGFLFGKTLAGVLDNASDPVKKVILSRLEKQNPKAYNDAIFYIGQKSVERIKGFNFVNTGLQQKATQELENAIKKVGSKTP